jgi:CRP-like cAMP-binding protein
MTSELILAAEKRRNVADIRSAAIARRLGSLLMLTPGETEFLHRVGAGPMSLWAPRSLIEQPAGNHASPRYIISGWAAQVRELNDGRRQLVQLVLPGDPLAPQLQIHHRGQTVQCLTMVQTVDGAAIRLAARDPANFPGIAAAVELAAARDRALLLDQVTRLGRQTAYERVANLFLELHYRCLPIGLVHANGFAFPLTQECLGDLLGLSVVHVNRTLQLMRRQNLITLRQGRLTLNDMPALQAAAEFKPPVLHRS